MKLLILTFLSFITINMIYAQDATRKKAVVAFKEKPSTKTKSVTEKDDETFAKEAATKNFKEAEVEQIAIFSDGDDAYTKFIQNNLNVKVPFDNHALPGKYQVLVNFVVASDGSVNSVKAQTNFGYGMEKEAERVVKLSNKLWKPAMLKNVAVNSETQIMLTFEAHE